MKDLLPCTGIREDFQRWLGCGIGPLTIAQGGVSANSKMSIFAEMKCHFSPISMR